MIVVHGVGNNETGSTVNYVVEALERQDAAAITADSYNEVYQLREPGDSWVLPVGTALETAKEKKAGKKRVDEFPVYARGAQLSGGGTVQFFELHWADLARTGNSWFSTGMGFARFIFEIPHVVDGFLRETRGSFSKLLRWTLLLLTCFVRGPLAGYCAVMLFGGLVFLSFDLIPDREDVRRLIDSVMARLGSATTSVAPGASVALDKMPVNPTFRSLLGGGLGAAIVLAIGCILWSVRQKRWAVMTGAIVVVLVSVFYVLDAFIFGPPRGVQRYPDYAGFVYIDYLSVMLFGLAAAGIYAFCTRRATQVGFADLGLSTAFWAIFIITHLSPLGDWYGHFAGMDVGVAATSSSVHFRAFEIYYPILTWLWVIWATLLAFAMVLAIGLYICNFWRWKNGFRGVFAAIALAVLQSVVWLSVLPAFGVLHMDDVLCRGNRYADGTPPVSCQRRLGQNHQVVDILRQIRSAEENRELGLVAELKQSLTRTLGERESLQLNPAMLQAMNELSLSFLWHSAIVLVSIVLMLLVVLARHAIERMNLRWRLPRLIISNLLLTTLFALGALNVVLVFSWVDKLGILDVVRTMLTQSSQLVVPKLSALQVPSEVVQMAMMAATLLMLLTQVPFISSALGGVLQIMQGLIDHHYRSRVCLAPSIGVPNADAPVRRDHITRRLNELVQNLVRRKESDLETHFDDVVFLAHSQGTVIVFDYLCQDVAKTALGDIRPDVVTVGSPLGDIYSYYFNEYGDIGSRIDKLAVMPRSWTNLYRSDDPIGGPIPKAAAPVSDLVIENIKLNRGGHLHYWENPTVSNVIRKILLNRS